MRFTNDARQSFDLALSRFADSGGGWLYVIGEVDNGTRTWRFEEPSMTAKEVRGLADRLRRITDGKTGRAAIDFLEPNLAFELIGRSPSRVVVRIILELEARPPWNDRARTDDEWRSVWLEFSLTPEQLHEASRDLRAQIEALEGQRWPLGRRPDGRG